MIALPPSGVTTYAVITPIREVKEGWRFRVKPPTWNATKPWIVHTFETEDLAWLCRHGWLCYYAGKHVEVRKSLSCHAAK